MSKMSRWFRMYDDFFQHPKTRRLTAEQKLVVIGAWAISSRSPIRGVCLIGRNLPAEPADIAREVDLPLSTVHDALGSRDAPGPVTRPGMFLTWGDDGVLYSDNWAERQFENDPTNAERQRRFRQKKRDGPGSEPDG